MIMRLIVKKGSKWWKGLPFIEQSRWWFFTHFWILHRIFARKNAELAARRGVGGLLENAFPSRITPRTRFLFIFAAGVFRKNGCTMGRPITSSQGRMEDPLQVGRGSSLVSEM